MMAPNPISFGRYEEEYAALRQGVGLVDYSSQIVIECSGVDRVDFLQRLLTNDLSGLKPGTGCSAALLTPIAHVIATLLVLCTEESFLIVCDLQRVETVIATLERYHFAESVTLTNYGPRQSLLALQGPRTMQLLSDVAPASSALSTTADHQMASINGISVRLIRNSLTGGFGVLVLADAQVIEALRQVFLNRGRRHGLIPVGWQAIDTARIEAGIPWWRVDFDEQNLLPETGLEQSMVSANKGCYVGQEIIARVDTYGSVNKRLLGLRIEGKTEAAAKDAIMQMEAVGWVTSACWSPALQCPLALGYLKRGAYSSGTSVSIVHGSTRLPAVVTALPFLKDLPG